MLASFLLPFFKIPFCSSLPEEGVRGAGAGNRLKSRDERRREATAVALSLTLRR